MAQIQDGGLKTCGSNTRRRFDFLLDEVIVLVFSKSDGNWSSYGQSTIINNMFLQNSKQIRTLAEEDWHMPIESSQYLIILFRVNKVFTFYHIADKAPQNIQGWLYHEHR